MVFALQRTYECKSCKRYWGTFGMPLNSALCPVCREPMEDITASVLAESLKNGILLDYNELATRDEEVG